MQKTINRAQFLRGDIRGSRQLIRPPWSKPEASFVDLCERCDECVKACPEGILVRGSGGFPHIDFALGPCTFCRACAEICRHQVFTETTQDETAAWELDVSINDSCLSMKGIVCRSCSDACESAAIRFQLKTGGRSIPRVSESRCNGCGECFTVCPSKSITILPSQRDCAA